MKVRDKGYFGDLKLYHNIRPIYQIYFIFFGIKTPTLLIIMTYADTRFYTRYIYTQRKLPIDKNTRS